MICDMIFSGETIMSHAPKPETKISHEYGFWYGIAFSIYESGTGSFASWCANRGYKPNHLTWLRIGLSPTLFVFHFVEQLWPAVVIMSVLLWLDIQDGRLARVLEARRAGSGYSKTGAFLDQAADKLTMIGAFWCLSLISFAPVSAAILITTLEIALFSARPIRNLRRAYAGLKPDEGRSNHFGKIKVWAEAVAWYGFMFGPESNLALVPYVSLLATVGF